MVEREDGKCPQCETAIVSDPAEICLECRMAAGEFGVEDAD